MYGYDGGKHVKGRKRHIIVDTLGLLLMVVVSEANMNDRLGATAGMLHFGEIGQHLKVLFVDQGYTGERFALAVLQLVGAKVEVVKRKASGFEVLPKRWIVERTLSWLAQNRRLSKDYELLPEVSENMIYVAMVRLMLRRLTTNKFAA